MKPFLIPILSFIAGIAIWFVLRYRNGKRSALIPLFLLCFTVPLHALNGLMTVDPFLLHYSRLSLTLFLISWFCVHLLLIETLARFIKDRITRKLITMRFVSIHELWVVRSTAFSGMVCALLISRPSIVFHEASPVVVVTDSLVILLLLLFVMAIYSLYLIEELFRAATSHQRRIARFFLWSTGVWMFFSCVFIIRCIVYRTIPSSYMVAMVIADSLFLPFLLAGLFRIRIGSYEVALSRETVYSSITLIASGSFLLGLGLTTIVVRRLGFPSASFELYLVVFSAAFFGLYVLTSEGIRRKVRLFVNTHIYQRKYDYRDQFFRLHQSYMAGNDLNESAQQLIATLTYSMNIPNVFIFLLNEADGNYYLFGHDNDISPAYSRLSGECALIEAFHSSAQPVHCTESSPSPDARTHRILKEQGELCTHLGITYLFPIIHNKAVFGILGVQCEPKRVLDMEDRTLIQVFSVSIGNVFFRYRMIRERLEQTQFNSFTHVASFLMHDIKNQVSTLTLLSKNASRNIANPAFQKSLLLSLESCTSNLQALVDKLSSPPREERIETGMMLVDPIVRDVVVNTGVESMPNMTMELSLNAPIPVLCHRQSLFFILKNLVVNAVEAMNNSGRLSITSESTASMDAATRVTFGFGERFIQTYDVSIIVTDTGPGMSDEFVKNSLFHPFTTTKDKGIGIGLYQSKTLVERMAGRLVCVSVPGAGTKFCILLKAATGNQESL